MQNKLYIFDPITTEKKFMSYNQIAELTGEYPSWIKQHLERKSFIKSINCYVCDESFTRKDLKDLMRKCKTPEIKKEMWKFIKENSIYQVSNLGRVRKINKTTYPTFLLPRESTFFNNFYSIRFNFNKKRKEILLHKVVAKLFVNNDDPVNKTYVIHKNGIKHDNRSNNLEYVTHHYSAVISGKNRERKCVIRKEIGTNEFLGIYKNAVDASKKTGVNLSGIYLCLEKKRATAGKSTWEYEEDEEY